jgi:LPLT family lysophospholipid transporter-like MFS transporter
MSRSIYTLVVAQFLSAFGDNAILFTVIAMLLQEGGRGAWYIAALQSAFLAAFVTLTPWVGTLADRLPKPRVLMIANAIKALGTLGLMAGLEPLLGYAIVGVGAAAYSPAKYGILPELSETGQLMRANSWVEGSTIAAILLGTVGGARLADASIPAALGTIVGLYLLSALVALWLPKLAARGGGAGSSLGRLLRVMQDFLRQPRARLVLLALSLFWASAATLRVVLVAWAPEVLHAQTATDIASLTLFMAIGIVIGAGLVPRLIPLERIRRTRYAAYAMSGLFLFLATVDEVWLARATLLGIGTAGGIFVVPLNATIQQLGHASVGSGSAVAVQNFFQNGAMLVSMALYTLAAARGYSAVHAILVLGAMVALSTVLVSAQLPRRPAS